MKITIKNQETGETQTLKIKDCEINLGDKQYIVEGRSLFVVNENGEREAVEDKTIEVNNTQSNIFKHLAGRKGRNKKLNKKDFKKLTPEKLEKELKKSKLDFENVNAATAITEKKHFSLNLDEGGLFDINFESIEENKKPGFFERKRILRNKEKTVFQNMLKSKNVEVEERGDFKIMTETYTIQKGDTLWAIAKKYDTTVEALLKLNEDLGNKIENPDIIQADKPIYIQKFGYQVKKGETLADVAEKFGVSEEMLRSMNNMEPWQEVKKKDNIEIPGARYKVRQGETLWRIAKNLGFENADKLIEINKQANPNFNPDIIHPGDEILVVYRDADYAAERIAPNKNDSEAIEVVQRKGDSDYKYMNKIRKGINKKSGLEMTIACRHDFEPIVGKKGCTDELKGKTIIVNAGHGIRPDGKYDHGTTVGTRFGLKDEYLVNYDNAMILIEKLCRKGAKVIYMQGYEGYRTEGLNLASREFGSIKSDMLISLHVNSSPTPPKNDRMEIYHYTGDSKLGSKLAGILNNKVDAENTNKHYADAYKGGKQILKQYYETCNKPGILWEGAFANTKKGAERLMDPKWVDHQMDLIAQSVVEYYK